jgi:hypothetical protein
VGTAACYGAAAAAAGPGIAAVGTAYGVASIAAAAFTGFCGGYFIGSLNR